MGTNIAGSACPVSYVTAPRDIGLHGGEMLGFWNKLLGQETLGLTPHPTRSQMIPPRNSPCSSPSNDHAWHNQQPPILPQRKLIHSGQGCPWLPMGSWCCWRGEDQAQDSTAFPGSVPCSPCPAHRAEQSAKCFIPLQPVTPGEKNNKP